MGPGTGCRQLVNLRSLGKRDEKSHSWQGVHRLVIIKGKIVNLDSRGRGEIELRNCGMRAFFVPAHGNESKGYVPGRDLNRDVQFYLSFSYDGLRAYNVRDVD